MVEELRLRLRKSPPFSDVIGVIDDDRLEGVTPKLRLFSRLEHGVADWAK